MATGVLLAYCLVVASLGIVMVGFGCGFGWKKWKQNDSGGVVRGITIAAFGSVLIFWGVRAIILGSW